MADYMEVLEKVITETIAPNAVEVDSQGMFPRANIEALGQAGLLGLISATEVGGWGEGCRAAAFVVERIARECGSTAMVMCMHYSATAVVEAHGTHEMRESIAGGRQLSTLAFSEASSRSHFWAPSSTATPVAGNGHVQLDARKSWATSAGEADNYVWSSRPMAVEGASTIWFVPSKTAGLKVPTPFNGLGLRGNASSAITAEQVTIEKSAMLGTDGGGFDIMMGIVLPYFQIINSAAYLGMMEAVTAKAAAHVSGAKLEHIGSSLADLPTIRAYIARMRIKTDMVRALLLDTLNAMETGRADTMLRVLEIKAAACETATEVTDLAMRVCGGVAFRKEVGIERHFRDARAGTVMSPTTDLLYDFIGKAVCGLPLF